MDQRTRKHMTMHKTLHLKDDMERLFVWRKEGGKEHENWRKRRYIGTMTKRLHLKKNKERLITATRNNKNNTGAKENHKSPNQTILRCRKGGYNKKTYKIIARNTFRNLLIVLFIYQWIYFIFFFLLRYKFFVTMLNKNFNKWTWE